jgi:putative hydrolase of the HAD superfamily
MSPKAILFDIGNVLVRYDHCRTMQAVAECCGLEPAALETIFRQVNEALGLGRVAGEDLFAQLAAEPDARPVAYEDLETAFCSGITRDDAALRYAVALQQRPGVTVGAISNTNVVHVAWLDEHVPELDELDLVIMSSEVHLLKPDPEIFELALELLDVPPQNALFVDDSAVNVAAAHALGIAVIHHVDWGETRPAIEAWLTG